MIYVELATFVSKGHRRYRRAGKVWISNRLLPSSFKIKMPALLWENTQLGTVARPAKIWST
ncbi:hypothetical protein [Microcoleus sp. FACHB-672]|uniref:hypothetical protein n=1 Tax=Microcoleus sp. FACHB-672 TaxID=2692825 RepID=UPI0016827FAA|nr:hypothetical protein [Microcoleus sp. FACHB-672]MBD2040217.1 hypothetical protein [Microcoleus sp. FACHB-672]